MKCQPFRLWIVVLEQSKFYEVENSTPPGGTRGHGPFDYMPSVLTTELRQCDTFRFMVCGTGSGESQYHKPWIGKSPWLRVPSRGVLFSTSWNFDCSKTIILVKVNTRNTKLARVIAPISTVNICSWSNRNFMKWKIAQLWWHANPSINNEQYIHMYLLIDA